MTRFVHRRNLDFVLFEMLRLNQLLQTPRFGHCDAQDVTAFLDTAEAIAREHYLPHAAAVDANEPRFVNGKVEMLPEVATGVAAYTEAGLFGAGFDHDLGGLQLPYLVTTTINGIFTCANLGIANYSFLTTAAANMLAQFASDAQKQTYLGHMIAGRWHGTMCLSEPQAGSSLSDIRTRADPAPDGTYRISGTKMWISGGDHELTDNIVHMVLARIPGGPPGVKGISLFIVPKYRADEHGRHTVRNDVTLMGLNHKMGQRGMVNCLLGFGDSGDCHGTLVGEPHKGLQYMFHMMNEARIVVGYGATMCGLGGYLYSLDYAAQRPQGRLPDNKDPAAPQVPISEHADVRRMLMAQKVAVEGSLALCSYCALLIDRMAVETDAARRADLALLLDVLTPIAKSWPSEFCLEANKLAMQVLGGYGYTREYPVERHYRDNRLNPIHEGTYAIHGIDLLGRKVRMEGGRGVDLLFAEIAQAIALAGSAGGLDAECARLEAAMAQVRATTQAVLACADPVRALANATLYLEAFGHVVVAWMWLWQAALARTALDAGTPDEAFYSGKIKACRFFFRHDLPKAEHLLALVASLDDSFTDVSVAELACA